METMSHRRFYGVNVFMIDSEQQQQQTNGTDNSYNKLDKWLDIAT